MALKILPLSTVLPSVFHLGSEGVTQGVRDNIIPMFMFKKVYEDGGSVTWILVMGDQNTGAPEVLRT